MWCIHIKSNICRYAYTIGLTSFLYLFDFIEGASRLCYSFCTCEWIGKVSILLVLLARCVIICCHVNTSSGIWNVFITIYVFLFQRNVSLLLDQGFKTQECCFFHPLSNDTSICKCYYQTLQKMSRCDPFNKFLNMLI